MNCARKRIAPGIRARSTLAALLAVPIGGAAASAQQGQAVGQASYIAAQAAAGGESYQAACAACHLRTLLGSGEAPPLIGRNCTIWGNRPVTDLLSYTRAATPPKAPRSLSEAEASAVVACIISENGVEAESDPLSFSSEGQVAMLPGDDAGLAGGAALGGPPGHHRARLSHELSSGWCPGTWPFRPVESAVARAGSVNGSRPSSSVPPETATMPSTSSG